MELHCYYKLGLGETETFNLIVIGISEVICHTPCKKEMFYSCYHW